MQFTQFLEFIVYLFLHKSQNVHGGYCRGNPVMSVCSESRMTAKRTIFIDTVNVPEVQNISCKCFVSTSVIKDKLNFKMENTNITERSKLKFEIEGKVLDSVSRTKSLSLLNRTELTFITQGYLKQEGACLNIYTYGNVFNISCEGGLQATEPRPFTEYTTQTQVTSIFTENTTQTSVGSREYKENGNNNILVHSVSGISGLIFGLATGFLGIYCCKRMRKIRVQSAIQRIQDNSNNLADSQNNQDIIEVRTVDQNVENVYNQVEHDGQIARISTVPDRNIRENFEMRHPPEYSFPINHDYDYSAGPQLDQQTEDCTEGETLKTNSKQDKHVFHQEAEDCTLYDSTVKATAKQCQDGNVYNHLESICTGKKLVK